MKWRGNEAKIILLVAAVAGVITGASLAFSF